MQSTLNARVVLILSLVSAGWLVGAFACSHPHGRSEAPSIITVGPENAEVTGDDNRAIQKAIDGAAAEGGGTVTIKAGTYTLYNSIRLASHITLRGEGTDKTILTKVPDVRSRLKVDADATDSQATVEDARGFAAGMGVIVFDTSDWQGLYPNVKTIQRIGGSTLFFDLYLGLNYSVTHLGTVANNFPLITGYDVEDVTISDLTADGNRPGKVTSTEKMMIGGGAIYFYHSKNLTIRNCVARNVGGDGISTQFVEDPIIENCDVYGNTAMGIHVGTSALRPIVRHNRIHNNGVDGLYLCWNVRHGTFDENECWENVGSGISIGHRDMDNMFTKNVSRDNFQVGILFRDAGVNPGNHDTLRDNVIENNGRPGAPGYGVRIDGATKYITLDSNSIRQTRTDNRVVQRVGIYLGPRTDYIICRQNVFVGNLQRALLDASKDNHNGGCSPQR